MDRTPTPPRNEKWTEFDKIKEEIIPKYVFSEKVDYYVFKKVFLETIALGDTLHLLPLSSTLKFSVLTFKYPIISKIQRKSFQKNDVKINIILPSQRGLRRCILGEIMNHLSISEILRYSLVSKEWLKICRGEIVWKNKLERLKVYFINLSPLDKMETSFIQYWILKSTVQNKENDFKNFFIKKLI
eukprot:TRINITY_DN11860_c0_g1_i1.p1 TRINITY_DN11860_c0_g1~~TRINITY_DN11860_c0_g1_i1.p1  ORF type:complete len:199 (+),score=44.89 TRINITY_DN11860_c0_g1_i1:40-597(+)